jgi:hypothetical protein
MIIGRFKSNHPLMIFVLLFASLLLWMDGFFFYEQTSYPVSASAPLYNLFSGFFNTYKGLSVFLSYLFMLIQAVMINRVITDKNLVDRNSWLPALMYITLMSSSFGLFGMQPVWFANFFLIIALDRMFEMYNDEVVNIEIFNVAFFISIASLFYLPALFFFFFILVTLIIYFILRVREILAALTGLILPYLFLALYFYWTDVLFEKVNHFTQTGLDTTRILGQITPYGWVFLLVLGLMALIAIMKTYFGTVRDKPIRIRRRYQVVMAFLLVSVASYMLAGEQAEIHYAVIMLPLSAVLAGFFQDNKRKTFNEILFTLLIVLIALGKMVRL